MTLCSLPVPRTAALLGLLLLSGAPRADAWTVLQNPAGQSVVLDEAHGNYWYRDLHAFANLTYGQQVVSIQGLNTSAYFGATHWHMATPADMPPLWALTTDALRQAFLPSHERYEGAYEWHYWSGRYAQSVQADVHAASETGWGSFFFGPWHDAWPNQIALVDSAPYLEHGAWVVTQIPEPGSAPLLALGSALWLLCRSRRQG